MEQEVQEYFEAYFGGQLNESTSDEDIMEAVYDLIELTEAVLEAVGFDTPIPNPLEKHDSVGGMRSDTWTAGQSMEKDRQAGRALQKAARTFPLKNPLKMGSKDMNPPRYNLGMKLMKKYKKRAAKIVKNAASRKARPRIQRGRENH